MTLGLSTLLTMGGLLAGIVGAWVTLSWRVRALEADRAANSAARKQIESLDVRLKGQGERIGAATAKADNLLGKWEGFVEGWRAAGRAAERRSRTHTGALPEREGE